MGFASGFSSGYNAVDQAVKDYERQKLKEGLGRLGPEATTATGQGYEVTSPTGDTQRGLITPQPGVDLDAIKQAYEAQGYQFRPVETPTFAARAGGKDVGIYGTEEAARGAAEPYNIGLSRQAATLYEKAGLDAEARQLRGQARQAETDMTRLGMEKERLGLAKDESVRADKLAEARLMSEGLSQEQAQLQIAQSKRAAEEQGKMDSFNSYIQENPNATRADLKTAAKTFGLSMDQQFNVVSRMTGMAEDDLKAFQADVKNTIKGKGLGELLDIHKNDPRFDDKTYFNQRKGPKGEVILDLVDQTTGKTIRSESFKDANLATAYLSKAALEPDTLAEWMLGIRGAEGKLRAQDASTAKDLAAATYYGSGSRTKFEVAGFDKDKAPILFNPQTGGIGRKDGKPIQDADFTKKFSGAADTAVSKREEIAYSQLLQSDEWKGSRTPKQRTDLLLKYNLDPAKFGMEAIPGGGWD